MVSSFNSLPSTVEKWKLGEKEQEKYVRYSEAFFVVVETKFLLSLHLATNSLGLGRLFYKSGHQLQNSRRHREQNGCNLEG